MNKDYTNTAIKVNTIVALLMPMMTLIMSGTNVAITWFGGHYIADMTLEVGNLIAFMTYAMQILIELYDAFRYFYHGASCTSFS